MQKRKMQQIGGVAILGMLLAGGAVIAANASPATSTPQDSSQILQSITTVLDGRNQQVVSGATTVSAKSAASAISSSYLPEVQAEYGQLNAFKSRLAAHGQSYSSVKTSVVSSTTSTQGAHATVEVLEHTALTYAPGPDGVSGPPYEYEYPQIISMSKGPTGWTVDSIKPKDPNGVPPSTVVDLKAKPAVG